MQIRPAEVTDVSAVLPMVASICALHETWDSAKYGFLPKPQQRYEQWLIAQAKNDKSVFLVAEDPQTKQLGAFLIGTVEREIPIYRLREFGFIHDLWVEPQYRHAGVAKQMVLLAIEHFQRLGVQQIRLDTAAANEAGRRLFSACGFRVSTVEMLIELR
ncbi:GNAT family N-acetyltransferase [Chroogloeocystis siderophila]|jgi:ribosomal protein S18 acetylase RimI-like enzyme|uniref:GNAT family N-acetyltransferase n=1 Tax=Chroogloeocystis siderophila 5.2 s.c.1 TaxID=247279 RepID=A0A1U7HEW9_9CHRO|nr:GNAT family N-acetyltransferase [Chroogloeocystis siderophila]OKH22091.1 GNAT family N-acetyltransferase [Chroogloeocystis siderophila 5.2 s.c.1]